MTTDTKAAPRYCPFCGAADTLFETCGAGFIEKGCYNGRNYCYEGDLPGFACSDCGGAFSLDVDDETIHKDCECRTHPSWCECDETNAHFSEQAPCEGSTS